MQNVYLSFCNCVLNSSSAIKCPAGYDFVDGRRMGNTSVITSLKLPSIEACANYCSKNYTTCTSIQWSGSATINCVLSTATFTDDFADNDFLFCVKLEGKK